MVVFELCGEKIDIILWNIEFVCFIVKVFFLVCVWEVFVDDEMKEVIVIVFEDQFVLVIGKEGLNVCFVVCFIGWKVDI